MDWVQTKAFDVLEWLAAMCSHVPNKGESSRGQESETMAITVPPWRDGARKMK